MPSLEYSVCTNFVRVSKIFRFFSRFPWYFLLWNCDFWRIKYENFIFVTIKCRGFWYDKRYRSRISQYFSKNKKTYAKLLAQKTATTTKIANVFLRIAAISLPSTLCRCSKTNFTWLENSLDTIFLTLFYTSNRLRNKLFYSAQLFIALRANCVRSARQTTTKWAEHTDRFGDEVSDPLENRYLPWNIYDE